jgi:hypothetical protein
MGISGRSFVDKHEEQTADLMRMFLDFMKAARLRLDDRTGDEVGSGPVALKESTDVKMTPEGYPLLPKYIVEHRLSKSVSEQILRDYLSQHYCELCNFIDRLRAKIP